MKFEFDESQVELLMLAVHNLRQRLKWDIRSFEEKGFDEEYPKEYEEMKDTHEELLKLYYLLGGK